MKPRLAFISFACCEGCALQVLNCEVEILAILGAVDIVDFREAMVRGKGHPSEPTLPERPRIPINPPGPPLRTILPSPPWKRGVGGFRSAHLPREGRNGLDPPRTRALYSSQSHSGQ